MKKELYAMALGLMAGMYIGYMKESELDTLCYKGKRAKKKMMRKMHQIEDGISDYLMND